MLRDKFVVIFLISLAFICLCYSSMALSQTDAMTQAAENQQSQDQGAQQQDSQQQGSPQENSEAGDGAAAGPELNISDSIPVDSLLADVQEEYQSLIDKTGLSNSLASKLILTCAILLIFLIVYFIVSKLTKLLANKLTHKAARYHISEGKVNFYRGWLIAFFFVILLAIALTALLATWEINIGKFIDPSSVASFVANVITIFLLIFIGAVCVEIACGLLERSFLKWSGASQSRIDTLLPIAKNTVYIACFVVLTLMLLAELGINVMPLLAGAGVLGFAIGFGAQTLIKDLLTGFIIIFEDLIQVGDVATLAGRSGIIERITIRKVQLRDLGGTVYTVPFSEIDIVENKTKLFSYYLMDIGIAYREDTDAVCELLHEVDADLREDENFKDVILDKLEILGVDAFADSAVIIKARIKTKPIEQWRVGREFNRRMKQAFDRNNIEIPFPHQTIYFGEDKDGNAPPLKLEKVNQEDADNDDADASRDNSSSGGGDGNVNENDRNAAPQTA